MKNEAKRAPGFPISATFFMAEGRFIFHALISALHLKKDPMQSIGSFFMAPPVGLEPTTCGLTVRRSTD